MVYTIVIVKAYKGIKEMKSSKQIKNIAEILRYSGFNARANYSEGVIVIKGASEEAINKIKSMFDVNIVEV